ncbi:MAG: hypothetical protein FJ150_10355 [Euryarchaeota archaeon]|nr:hypothetical protein [Euryarchaeota archaeon]
MKHKFATCLNCMDGRVQLPVIQWIKENYDVDYIDMITEAGMDGVLANKRFKLKNILKKIGISIGKHKSRIIFIVGHYDCSGNSVDEKTHKIHILKAVQRIKSFTSSCQIIGLWVTREFLVEIVE